MDFFREDETLNLLTADDRIEIFLQILTGSTDVTKELLDELLFQYAIGHLEIIEKPRLQFCKPNVFQIIKR